MENWTDNLEHIPLSKRRRDLSGEAFGKWVVESYVGRRRYGFLGRTHAHYWLCRCECGEVRTIQEASLKSGTSTQCELCGKGEPGGSFDPLYATWLGMKGRCSNPKHADYKYYGARGIRVCIEWQRSFKKFLDDVGERPEGKTLDRIDTNGNYEPGNVRWAAPKEQALNIKT